MPRQFQSHRPFVSRDMTDNAIEIAPEYVFMKRVDEKIASIG